jgi:heme o synthase
MWSRHAPWPSTHGNLVQSRRTPHWAIIGRSPSRKSISRSRSQPSPASTWAIANDFRGPFHDFPVLLLIHTLLGTLLVAGGAGALNQYIERRFDAQMRRTAQRPVASGRLKPSSALWFGMGLSAAGGIYLAVAVNVLASLLAIFTLLSYLFFYTPLKRQTPFCTVVGAFAGAMPPLIGWAAVNGSLNLGQFPYFMAIAWMYREDYDRAGYLVLPRGLARVHFVIWQAALPLLRLNSISLLATPLVQFGFAYLVGASLLGAGFIYYTAQFMRGKSIADARRLLLASIIYLPSLLLLKALAND